MRDVSYRESRPGRTQPARARRAAWIAAGALAAVGISAFMIASAAAAPVVADTKWQLLPTATSPIGVRVGKVVWDTHDQEMVQLTRVEPSAGHYQTLTWAYQSGKWVQRAIATPQFFNGELTNDPSDGYVLFLGACPDSGTCSSQTWAFYGNAWHHLFPASQPGPRLAPGLTYDSAIGKVVLFGGHVPNQLTGYLADTWTYHAGTWVRLSLSYHPAVRADAGFAGDAAAGAPILFGGGAINPTRGVIIYSDTWAFESYHWVRINVTVHPSARAAGAFTYDANNRVMIYEGGDTGSTGGPASQTWAFVSFGPTSGTWKNLNAPGAFTDNAGMTYNPVLGHPVELVQSFTGNGTNYLQTWEFV